MSHRGGKKRVRDTPAGWSSYYGNKQKSRKDQNRLAELLDSSAATAINFGQQPTLARRRRQLADDKWGESTTAKKGEGEEIFKDLVSCHGENGTNISKPKANPMLINSRKSFWKRKLSNLSTKDFDTVWKEGRNKFLKYINNHNPGQPAAAAATAATGVSTGPNTQDRQGLKDPPSHESMTAGGGMTKNNNAGTLASASNKNDKSARGKKSSNPKPNEARLPIRADVIDLCDSDSEDEANTNKSANGNAKIDKPNHKNEPKNKEWTKFPLDQTLVIRNLSKGVEKQDILDVFQPFATITNTKILGARIMKGANKEKLKTAFVDYDSVAPVLEAMKMHNDTPLVLNGTILSVKQRKKKKRNARLRKAGGEESIIGVRKDNKEYPTKKENNGDGSDVNQNPRESPAIAPPAPAVPARAFKPNASPARAIATPTNKKKPKESPANHWSKLFLGPEFRTDHVFSLGVYDDGI